MNSMAKEETKNVDAAEMQKKLSQYRQLAGLRDEIKDGVLRSVEDQLQVLSELGFSYRLVEGNTRASAAKTKRPKKILHCEICNVDGHDKRAHKNQKPRQAFTPKELEERGLVEAG